MRDFGAQDFRPDFGRFNTVSIFNVLEHTFDPITVLENALKCLSPGGNLLVLTPSIWPIHSYPGDYNRLLPDWYKTFARRNSLQLLDEHFCWLSPFGIERVHSNGAEPSFPSFHSRTKSTRYLVSKIVHKLFNTYGRNHWATHAALACAFRLP